MSYENNPIGGSAASPAKILTVKTLAVGINFGVEILDKLLSGTIVKPAEEVDTHDLIAAALTSELEL